MPSSEERRSHWEGVYTARREDEVSWYQENPEPSLELLALTGATSYYAIIDIGGGAARLVDALLACRYEDVTVLDVSAAALDAARARVGAIAEKVTWIAADVTTWQPSRLYDVWHDRAALHFLTDPADRQAYRDVLDAALRPGGHVIVGTFAPDGPEKCSGLPVMRHDAGTLQTLLGNGYTLIDNRRHKHVTPWGSTQQFQFSTFHKVTTGDTP